MHGLVHKGETHGIFKFYNMHIQLYTTCESIPHKLEDSVHILKLDSLNAKPEFNCKFKVHRYPFILHLCPVKYLNYQIYHKKNKRLSKNYQTGRKKKRNALRLNISKHNAATSSKEL